jgi:hypothetical protein
MAMGQVYHLFAIRWKRRRVEGERKLIGNIKIIPTSVECQFFDKSKEYHLYLVTNSTVQDGSTVLLESYYVTLFTAGAYYRKFDVLLEGPAGHRSHAADSF